MLHNKLFMLFYVTYRDFNHNDRVYKFSNFNLKKRTFFAPWLGHSGRVHYKRGCYNCIAFFSLHLKPIIITSF